MLTSLNEGWVFTSPDGSTATVDVPHTWNNIDGQDGGNDYWRGTCTYERSFPTPGVLGDSRLYLQFDGVNATADVTLNGTPVAHHDGGYSTFRMDVTDALAPADAPNALVVRVDNSVNDHVYPQKADFTFYGGIYRDVTLVEVPATHLSLDYHGAPGIKVTPALSGDIHRMRVETWVDGPGVSTAVVHVTLLDAQGAAVAEGMGTDVTLSIAEPHLWDGTRDPYLYTVRATLSVDGQVADEVSTRVGIRTFSVDPKEGFFLNGRPYALRGVSRHQDRRGIGNALTPEMHREDMQILCELGANTVRLAHYQHSQVFYDLCDEYGIVVWAEIPYISEHLPKGRENTVSQMTELIVQNYNHPSIVCWGLSNEITISTKDKTDMLDNHHQLNDLVHQMDPTRRTTLACYAMCGPFNRSAHVSDLVSWNLYLGWYVPGLFLNDLWFGFFHAVFPKRCVGMSEYGCEAMPNLHSEHPHRGDHTEEYQAIYHEYMLRFFARHPYLWATHVWNLFDFAADARDQGGEPGMNHKGLVTFDRKTRKDAFYLYKAWWNPEPMVHVCSKRFHDRARDAITVKVYSNQAEVILMAGGTTYRQRENPKNPHVFEFRVPLAPGDNTVIATADGGCMDEATFCRVPEPNPLYTLVKRRDQQKSNWV